MIERVNLFNTEMIGVFAQASNSVVALPEVYAASTGHFFERLGFNVLPLDLGGISSVGIMVVLNDNGLVLPYNAVEDDLKRARALGVNVYVSRTRTNAIGNMITVNNRIGFASPKMPRSMLRSAEDVLGVELVQTTIARIPTIGSSLVLNSKGFLCHPEATDEEIEEIRRVAGLEGGRVTVNGGYPYIKSGTICNDKVALVGINTTGIEMSEIERVLQL